MILVIDNYDSFTYNVVQLLGELGAAVVVHRNDEITVEGIGDLNPDGLVISPGPGGPESAGVSCDAIRAFAGTIPIFGVCLGQQCIGAVYGGNVIRAGELVHGKTSDIHHEAVGVFEGIPTPFAAVRYHSLVVEADSMPPELVVTASTSNGLVMGLRHRTLPIEGVQFHPESIASEHGATLMGNFLGSLTPKAEVA